MSIAKTSLQRKTHKDCWILLCTFACLAAIWLPYGFSMGGIVEEWDLLRIEQKSLYHGTCFPGQPYGDVFGVRPLVFLPSALLAPLSGNSFLGFHAVLLLGCAMKILAGIAIARFLFRDTTFALCFGLLFLVYPADTQQITLRISHVNLAIGLSLFGTVLFLKGFLSRGTMPKLVFLLGSAFLLILSTLIYEFGIVLYALPVALVFMRLGFLRTLNIIWRKKKTLLIWLAAPVLSLSYIVLVMKFNPGSYQNALSPNGVLHDVLHNSKYLVYCGVYRTFYEGWADSFVLCFSQVKNPLVFVVFLFFLIPAVYSFGKKETIRGVKTRWLIRYLVFGFGLFTIGYLPALPSHYHCHITQRTFLYVVPGAVIVLTSLLFSLFRYSRPAILTILVGLVFSGLVFQNYQHFRYTEFYTQSNGPYLNYVAAAANPDKRIHVVLDRSGYATYLLGLFYTKIFNGPPVILHKMDDLFYLCKDSPRSVQDGKVVVSTVNAENMTLEEKDVDVITIPRTSLPQFTGRPLWNDMNTYNPRWAPFYDPHLNDGLYIFKADSTWGYSDFPRGTGWYDGYCEVVKFLHKSIIVSAANSASLFVDLGHVRDTDYLFRFRACVVIPEQIRRELTASLNGEPLQLDFVGSKHIVFQSVIPKGEVKDGMNELSFTGVLPAEGVRLTLKKFLLGPKDKVIQEDGKEGVASLETGIWYKADNGTIWPYLYSGFSGNEPTGTWTDGTPAVIRFTMSPSRKIKKIHLRGTAYLAPAHPRFEMVVSLNGKLIGKETAEQKEGKYFDLSYEVPLTAANVNQEDNQIMLSIPHPATPQEIGTDPRFLGFFLTQLMVEGDAR